MPAILVTHTTDGLDAAIKEAVELGGRIAGVLPTPLVPMHALPLLWAGLEGTIAKCAESARLPEVRRLHSEAYRACLLATCPEPSGSREDLVADYRERHRSVWIARRLMQEAVDAAAAALGRGCFFVIIVEELPGLDAAARWLPSSVRIIQGGPQCEAWAQAVVGTATEGRS